MQHNGLVFPVMPIPMTPPVASPQPNFLTTPSQVVSQQVRKCIFDPSIRTLQYTMVLDQIFEAIRKKGRKEYDIDMVSLASGLTSLIPRMRKTAMEMIYEYHNANPSKVQVMGRPSDVPYRGINNKNEDYLEFNLIHFPDSLVIGLYEFVLMTKIHQPNTSHQ